ncbi:MAG TPA: DegV family protein [Bellilinea sp.]|nr:DegV family protein [Bellilinea sp.]
MKIKIVTDSTSDLPGEIAREMNIDVVPAYININGESFLDGVNLSRQEFYTRLPEYPQSPTTAAPGLAAFVEAYEKAAEDGAQAIISIHVAETLSSTINAARQAKELFSRIPVWVVDSGQVSLGLGLQALEAAKSVIQNVEIEEIFKILADFRQRTYLYAVMDTLEFLRRSGRVARYRAILGSMLKIKPIISFHDSLIKMEMAVTTARAFKRVQEIVATLAPLESISFVHTLAQSKVDEMQQLLQDFIPRSLKIMTHEVTPAIGAHVGPGAAGVICIRS